MNYKYEIIDYDKNIPAKIMDLVLSSDTHKTELHWHREPEIVYVIDGAAECLHNSETLVIEKSDIMIFNSEDVHLVRPAKGQTVRLLFIQLSIEYMRIFCKNIDGIYFDIKSESETEKALKRVIEEIASNDLSVDEYATLLDVSYIGKIYYLLLKYCTRHKKYSADDVIPRRDFSYAKTAIAYINENYKREITLNEISAVVNLSPSYFSKYFKMVTKIGFSDYMANLRLENAIEDMITKNSTVAIAALDNGFANVKSFITQCKKMHGFTPAQYKKHLLNR